MEYELNLKDIKERIFKDKEGWSNYIHVSIEEMDWLVLQAEKAEQYSDFEQIKTAYEDRVDDIKSLEGSLREIDTHIRSTDNPIPHIVKVLKDSLPEYHMD